MHNQWYRTFNYHITFSGRHYVRSQCAIVSFRLLGSHVGFKVRSVHWTILNRQIGYPSLQYGNNYALNLSKSVTSINSNSTILSYLQTSQKVFCIVFYVKVLPINLKKILRISLMKTTSSTKLFLPLYHSGCIGFFKWLVLFGGRTKYVDASQNWKVAIRYQVWVRKTDYTDLR